MSENFTDARLVDIWTTFLRGYQIEGRFYYFERLKGLQHIGLKTLYVDYEHLVDAIQNFVHIKEGDDEFNVLRSLVIYNTDKARETLRKAAFELLKEVNEEYAASIFKLFRAEFTHAPIEKEITQLTVDDAGKFIKTTGFITEYDEMSQTLIHYIAWRCPDDHITHTDTPDRPKKCNVNECGSPILYKDDKESFWEDFIRFKLQQRSDRTLEGKSPAIMEMETIGVDNVRFIKEQIKFGAYVGVSGIVRTKFSRRSSGQGKSLGDTYIEASSIETLPDSYLIADDPDSWGEQIKFTIRRDSEEEDLKKVIRSMFPSIHLPESDILKEICLMQLVGSDPIVLPDGHRMRGEIQLLFLGDPGTGKSTIAEFYKHARKRVMYNSAGKSTTVGLVGGMKQDRDGRWQIASGVFGLAGDGIVILDEFANRTAQEYADLNEPMSDSQTISIAKGASYRQEAVNTAVLAIANPATFSRYYDTTKNIYENTKIPQTMLQRMDAILIRKDTPDPKEDEARARHVFEMISKGVTEREYRHGDLANVKRQDENFYPVGYIAKWLVYVRNIHPRFTDNRAAVELVIQWYLKWRKFSITIKDPSDKDVEFGGMTIPGTDMRRLASVMRLSNAHARACQRDYVEERDVEWAISVNELTQAEAGVWRQTEDGSKVHMKDELAAHHSLMVERAAAKERQIFENVIDKLTWLKCKRCHGSGEMTGIGEEEILQCEDCEGHGFIPQTFSKPDAIRELIDIKQPPDFKRGLMSGRAFEIIWEEKRQKLEIIPTDYGRFQNTTPRQMREMKTSSNKMMSPEQMRKQALIDDLKRKNPTRAERLLKE